MSDWIAPDDYGTPRSPEQCRQLEQARDRHWARMVAEETSTPTSLAKMTDEVIKSRLGLLERLIAHADTKDLLTLNRCFQLLIDEQVRRDLVADERWPEWKRLDRQLKGLP